MARAAQLVEYHFAVVAFELATRGCPGSVLNDLWNLWHVIINARQGIRLVIDDDKYLKLVKLHHSIRKRRFDDHCCTSSLLNRH
jgi:hypothetical protein